MRTVIDFDSFKMVNETGIELSDFQDYLDNMERAIDYLTTHNKNYTKKQEFYLDDIKGFFKSIRECGYIPSNINLDYCSVE